MEGLKLKISDFEKHIQKSISQPTVDYTPEKKAKMAQAARDFESLLSSMMIKSMTKSTGGMFGESGYGGDMLDTFFEQEMSQFMSRGQGLGVASMLYQKLTGEQLPVSSMDTQTRGVSTDFTEYKIDETEKSDIPGVMPSSSSINRLNKYDDIIEKAAKEFGVDKNLIKSIILTESAANEKAISKVKAKGLMQLMDDTAKDMGVKNVWNPKDNIYGGTKYISQMLQKYDGDLKLSLAAYNAGPGNVNKYGGVPPFEETQNYISRVVGYLNHFEG